MKSIVECYSIFGLQRSVSKEAVSKQIILEFDAKMSGGHLQGKFVFVNLSFNESYLILCMSEDCRLIIGQHLAARRSCVGQLWSNFGDFGVII